MSEPIDLALRRGDPDGWEEQLKKPVTAELAGKPSNAVYARVGDTVLQAAREGVRRGEAPEEIIRGIVTQHGVRLNLSEFRLLLASRRIPE